MLKRSPLGALALFLTTLAAHLTGETVAWLTYKRHDSTIYGATTAVLSLTIMFLSSGVTSTSP